MNNPQDYFGNRSKNHDQPVESKKFAALRANQTYLQSRLSTYLRSTAAVVKESLKRMCTLGYNFVTTNLPFYQRPPISSLHIDDLPLLFVRDRPAVPSADKPSAVEAGQLRYIARIRTPEQTAAPMDKYRKPAGTALNLEIAEDLVASNARRAKRAVVMRNVAAKARRNAFQAAKEGQGNDQNMESKEERKSSVESKEERQCCCDCCWASCCASD